jgi:murein DD-endopeptidase MepM/ murein hydrolase activator NlpD
MQRMRLARGVVTCLAAAVLTAAPAGPAWADAAASTDTTSTTTEAAASTQADTTTAVDTTTTTAPPTAGGTSTTAAASTDAGAAIPVAQPIDQGCIFGGVVLLLPHHAPLLIGPAADAPSTPVAAMSNLLYPADGSIVTATTVALEGSGCANGRPAGGKTRLDALSLFGGAITADSVGLTIADAGARHADAISGLEIDGTAVHPTDGTQIALGTWGYLVTGTVDRIRVPAASGTEPPPLRVQASALAVHLLQSHAGLPAGTVLLISFAGLPGPVTQAQTLPPQLQPTSPINDTTVASKAEPAQAKPARPRKHKGSRHHAPFKITPPLGSIHYVFPVTGNASFGDTYGAFRGDVPGNWHHGDDIFAAFGTPVVAVADGTVNRVGWQKIGGWRIWVVDTDGNWFYYAHLSGYSPAVIHSKTVKAGEVIGFVGNSGDAITTQPHLHFEIHPKDLRHFGYDGAVDPTRYLDGWSHLQHVRAPWPAHPRLPKATAARQEARHVFRELLAARGLLGRERPATQPARPSPPEIAMRRSTRPTIASRTEPAVVAASPVAARASAQAVSADTTALAIGGSLLALLALSGSTLAVSRRRTAVASEDAIETSVLAPDFPAVASAPTGVTPREAARTLLHQTIEAHRPAAVVPVASLVTTRDVLRAAGRRTVASEILGADDLTPRPLHAAAAASAAAHAATEAPAAMVPAAAAPTPAAPPAAPRPSVRPESGESAESGPPSPTASPARSRAGGRQVSRIRVLPVGVAAGTGSLALVTASVLLLRRRSARARNAI